MTDESDTTNNCSVSLQVTVQTTVNEPQGDPDLTVTSPSVSDRDPRRRCGVHAVGDGHERR